MRYFKTTEERLMARSSSARASKVRRADLRNDEALEKQLNAEGRYLEAAAAGSGGTLIGLSFDRSEWDLSLARYAPGCGAPTPVVGTNGGTMPCGAKLRQLDGSVERYFCGMCEPKPTNLNDGSNEK